MITVIIGKPNTGKTILAKQLTKDKKAIWLDGYDLSSSFAFASVTTETECLVLDDIKTIRSIPEMLLGDKLTINKRGHWPKTINLPDIIITSSTLTLDDFSNPVFDTIIEMKNSQSRNSFALFLNHENKFKTEAI